MKLRYHAFSPPRPCRHEITPATVTHPGLGLGPTFCHRIDLLTGHLFVGPDIFTLTRVAPENIIWPGPPPKIPSSARTDKPCTEKKEKVKKPTKQQQKLADMAAFIKQHL